MSKQIVVIATLLLSISVAVVLLMTAAPELPLSAKSQVAPPVNKVPAGISAIGRLEPAGEVVRLSATIPGQTARIESLLVKEGSRVSRAQVVAILDGYKRLRAAVAQAQAQVAVARAHLAQVKAGAKSGDIEAQKALIHRLEAEHAHAATEFGRYESLHRQGAMSTSQLDLKKIAVTSLFEQLLQARSQLESIKEVRVTDVNYAEAQVESCIAAVARAQAEMDSAVVHAPRSGQILKIFAKPGEIVGTDGIAELGETGQMYAVAEVYQTDVCRLHKGQSAQIMSDAFAGKLQGSVEMIAHKVGRKSVLDPDPAYDVDQRVVEVKIRLSRGDSIRVSGFTNLRVQIYLSA